MAAGLSAAEGQVKKSAEAMAAKLAGIGKTMTIVGGAITAAMGLMGKAAIDEEINIARLATTMKNVGTSYNDVKDSLEAVIATTQRKTGIADNEQRDILNRLILTTGDYRKSLELLPTVLDLAAAGEMDATTAATYLGKAHNELAKGAETVSVRFGQASLQFKSMEDIQNRVAGSAEALANPLNILKASMGDVAETIGAFLIPSIKNVVDKIADIAIKVQEWANAHKPLMEIIVKFVAIASGIMAVLGPILMALPLLTTLFSGLGIVMAAICSPIGLVVAAAIALYVAWKENFGGIRDFTDKIIEKLKGPLDWLSDKVDKIKEGLITFGKRIGILKDDLVGGGGAIGAFGKEIASVADQIKEKLGGTIEELKKMADLEIIFRPAEAAIKKIIDSMTPYEKQLLAINERYDEAIEKIKTYITNEDELKAATDKLNEGRKAEITLLDRQKTAFEKLAEAKEKLTDALKTVSDRIYELTHTELENQIRKLDELKQSYLDMGMPIDQVMLWYNEEMKKIRELMALEDESIEKKKTLADAYKTIGDSIFEMTHTPFEIAKRKLDEQKQAYIDLGMSIAEVVKWYDLQIAKLNELKPVMKGYTNDIIAGSRVSRIAGSQADIIAGSKIPVYATGTPYVPKTGLYQLHQGEAVIPKNQNTTNKQNYSFSPIVNLTVSGGGNAQNIAYEVKKVLDESIRQFRRSGFELVPGRG